MKDKIIELGKEIYITDPCYDTMTWCQALIKNAKEGKWLVNYEYNEYEDGTEQQVILSLAHEDYGMAIFNDYYDEIKESSVLGVDSGTLGVFDKEYYEKYHCTDKIDDEWYNNNICSNKALRRGANITDDKGVWCNTSYGDGEYSANLYIKDGQVYGIEIVM